MRAAKERKGGIIVEAAVTFPVFVLMTAAMCWLVKACCIQTVLFAAVEDQIRESSAKSVFLSSASVKKSLDSAGVQGEGYSAESTDENISVAGTDGFERLKFTYDTKIQLPVPLADTIKLNNRIMFRKWTGCEYSGSPFGFDSMMEGGEGNTVYVFPLAGVRYHREDCRVTQSAGRVVRLDRGIRKKYDPCPCCTTGLEKDGRKVFVFEYGNCYHNSGCHAVTKYVMTMDEADAAEKGYTPCGICGG